jgi:hypothetical protein
MADRLRGSGKPFALGCAIGLLILSLVRASKVLSFSLPIWMVVSADRPEVRDLSFTERHSVEFSRELVLARRLQPLVERIYAAKGSPVSIMSGQAGAFPYYLAQSIPGKFRFIDALSIVTRDVSDCVKKTPGIRVDNTGYGIWVTPRELFAKCPTLEPDIVFEPNGSRFDAVLDTGQYTFVGSQDLGASVNSWFERPRREVQYLAVRKPYFYLAENALR